MFVISLVERNQPDIGANEVLVQIDHVGICGSDVHYYHGENSGNVVEFPPVLCHEAQQAQ